MKELYPRADHFKVTLYASLAKTGRGHMTDTVLEESFAPLPVEIVFDCSDREDLDHPCAMDIEPYCGADKLACERATDEDIAAMATAVEHLKENPSKYEYDVEFHDSLAVASHNSMLAATIHLVNNLIADVRIRFWDLPDYQERTQQSHYAIYQAVCDRDVERAQLEMSRHLAIVDEFSEKYPGRSMGEEEPPIP